MAFSNSLPAVFVQIVTARAFSLLHIRFGHAPQQNRLYSDLYKNASLWKLYTRNPYAAGFGIDPVFWFKEDRDGRVLRFHREWPDSIVQQHESRRYDRIPRKISSIVSV
jgi:hypothetical protein